MLITPGDPESDEVNACGGTSCATPHVGGAAALLWGDVAADGGAGSVAQRVRDRLVAQALDVGAPGPDTVFGAGRLRLDLAAPVLGVPTPAPNSLVRGAVALALPLVDAGTLGLQQLAVDGTPLVATLAPGGVLQATWPTAGLAPGPHVLSLVSSDQSGNVATYSITLRVDNQAPKVRLRSPLRARAARQGQDLGLGARRRQRPRGPAADHASATARRRTASISRTATSARAATSSRSARPIAPATPRSCGGRCASAPAPREAALVTQG